jgi:hypothetical protein
MSLGSLLENDCNSGILEDEIPNRPPWWRAWRSDFSRISFPTDASDLQAATLATSHSSPARIDDRRKRTGRWDRVSCCHECTRSHELWGASAGLSIKRGWYPESSSSNACKCWIKSLSLPSLRSLSFLWCSGEKPSCGSPDDGWISGWIVNTSRSHRLRSSGAKYLGEY